MSLPFVGHREIHRQLEGWRQAGRLPHAMMFLGPEGVGKALVARHLAAALLCAEKAGPCGACRSCELLAKGQHPDLFELKPDGGRIKIDSIRELKRSFALPPLVSSARVVLIAEAHAMNAAAANALLKTLEEPPSATYFILGSHAAGWVPRTILSRCQKVRFPPLSHDELEAVLQAKGISGAAKALDWAQGSAKAALQLGEVETEIPSLEELWGEREGFGLAEAYTMGQTLYEAEKLEPFLESLLRETHQYLLEERHPERRFELLGFAERILEFRGQMRQNANPKLHLPRLLMYFREPLESRL
ncbi:MAG TPA: DNA polymerase III subunit delta' [bacterium]|nr:DNA polymerase III subunit delta' [bacterium]